MLGYYCYYHSCCCCRGLDADAADASAAAYLSTLSADDYLSTAVYLSAAVC